MYPRRRNEIVHLGWGGGEGGEAGEGGKLLLDGSSRSSSVFPILKFGGFRKWTALGIDVWCVVDDAAGGGGTNSVVAL